MRQGYSTMPSEVDDRYLRYLVIVALTATSGGQWPTSMISWHKDYAGFGIVSSRRTQTHDPYQHLRSIHNATSTIMANHG